MYKESIYMIYDKRLKYITYNKRCTAGTSIGERLTTAFTECSPGLMRWGSLISILFCILYSAYFHEFSLFIFMPCVQEGGEEDPVLSQWWPVLQVLISFENLDKLFFLEKNRFTVTGIYFCNFVLQLRGDHGLGGRGVCWQVALLLAQKCRQYRLSMWRPNEQWQILSSLAFSIQIWA